MSKKFIFSMFLIFFMVLMSNCIGTFAEDTSEHLNEPILEKVNFIKADLVTILQQLATESGYNLVTTPEVKGTISIKLTKVSFEEILKLICRSRGLIYQKEGRNYYVGTRGQSFDDRQIIGYFHIFYADPNQLVALLKKVIENEDIYFDERTRTVVINSNKDIIGQASNIIESLDKKMPQITIEIKVVEISTTALRQLATEWKIDDSSSSWGPTSSGAELILKMIGSGHSWSLIFKNLVQNGNAHLVTSPSVSTVDGKEASILIGDKIPIETTTKNNDGTETVTNVSYVDVGVKLNFTPKVQKEDELIIDLKTQINSIGEKNIKYYNITAREVNSSIQARIGQTVFLGGLITRKERESLAKIPGFGDIPLLGGLFKRTEKSIDETEVILTITPRWNDSISILSPDDSLLQNKN